MKKALAFILAMVTCIGILASASQASDTEPMPDSSTTTPSSALEINAKSAVLMEAKTGTVLYQKQEYLESSPASVTKIMTLLLVAEALEAGAYELDDEVSISSYAASMGGSQVFLEEGEIFTVEELIKCTVIASANDAAVALAEFTAGTEDAFVKRMNERSGELGLTNTCFENTTGLDDTTLSHYSCAMDIAIMSRELIKHDIILKYSALWQDTIRNGEFTLTNTNRLVRYYSGCNGLKTGSTDKAGFCVSTTAKRGNMQLIAVVMGAESTEERNACARAMLDFGFAGYTLAEFPSEYLENIPVIQGRISSAQLYSDGFTILIEKAKASKIEEKYIIPESISAPVKKNSAVGKILYYLDGEKIGETNILVGDEVESVSFFDMFLSIMKNIFCGRG